MEPFPFLFAALTRKEFAFLPETKNLCNALLEDSSFVFPEHALEPLHRFFFEGEALDNEFIFQLLIKSLRMRRAVRGLIEYFVHVHGSRSVLNTSTTFRGLKLGGAYLVASLGDIMDITTLTPTTLEAFKLFTVACDGVVFLADDGRLQDDTHYFDIPHPSAVTVLLRHAEEILMLIASEQILGYHSTLLQFLEILVSRHSLAVKPIVALKLLECSASNWINISDSSFSLFWRMVAVDERETTALHALKFALLSCPIDSRLKSWISTALECGYDVWAIRESIVTFISKCVSEKGETEVGLSTVRLQLIQQIVSGARATKDRSPMSVEFLSCLCRIIAQNQSTDDQVHAIEGILEELLLIRPELWPLDESQSALQLLLTKTNHLTVERSVLSRIIKLLVALCLRARHKDAAILEVFSFSHSMLSFVSMHVCDASRDDWFGRFLVVMFFHLHSSYRQNIILGYRNFIEKTDWNNVADNVVAFGFPCALRFLLVILESTESMSLPVSRLRLPKGYSLAEGVTPLDSRPLMKAINRWLELSKLPHERLLTLESADFSVFHSLNDVMDRSVLENKDAPESVLYDVMFGSFIAPGRAIGEKPWDQMVLLVKYNGLSAELRARLITVLGMRTICQMNEETNDDMEDDIGERISQSLEKTLRCLYALWIERKVEVLSNVFPMQSDKVSQVARLPVLTVGAAADIIQMLTGTDPASAEDVKAKREFSEWVRFTSDAENEEDNISALIDSPDSETKKVVVEDHCSEHDSSGDDEDDEDDDDVNEDDNLVSDLRDNTCTERKCCEHLISCIQMDEALVFANAFETLKFCCIELVNKEQWSLSSKCTGAIINRWLHLSLDAYMKTVGIIAGKDFIQLLKPHKEVRQALKNDMIHTLIQLCACEKPCVGTYPHASAILYHLLDRLESFETELLPELVTIIRSFCFAHAEGVVYWPDFSKDLYARLLWILADASKNSSIVQDLLYTPDFDLATFFIIPPFDESEYLDSAYQTLIPRTMSPELFRTQALDLLSSSKYFADHASLITMMIPGFLEQSPSGEKSQTIFSLGVALLGRLCEKNSEFAMHSLIRDIVVILCEIAHLEVTTGVNSDESTSFGELTALLASLNAKAEANGTKSVETTTHIEKQEAVENRNEQSRAKDSSDNPSNEGTALSMFAQMQEHRSERERIRESFGFAPSGQSRSGLILFDEGFKPSDDESDDVDTGVFMRDDRVVRVPESRRLNRHLINLEEQHRQRALLGIDMTSSDEDEDEDHGGDEHDDDDDDDDPDGDDDDEVHESDFDLTGITIGGAMIRLGNDHDGNSSKQSESSINSDSEDMDKDEDDSVQEVPTNRPIPNVVVPVQTKTATELKDDREDRSNLDSAPEHKTPGIFGTFTVAESLASLLPRNRWCTSSEFFGEFAYPLPMYRCLSCFGHEYRLLCSACAQSCHGKHRQVVFEGFVPGTEITCSCQPNCAIRKTSHPATRNSEMDIEGSKIPKYLEDVLLDPVSVVTLVKVLEEMNRFFDISNIPSKVIDDWISENGQGQQADSIETLSVLGNCNGFEGFDLWKGLETAKQLMDHINRIALTTRRLAACDMFVAICEGSFVSIASPAPFVCSRHASNEGSTSFHLACTNFVADVLSQTELGFAVLQSEFNASNQNLLAVAGMNSLCVLALTSQGTLAKKMPLSYNADLNDPVRKLLWLPNSRSELCVITGQRVRIFDVFASDRPLYSYKLADEIAPLVDGLFLPLQTNVLLLLSTSGCFLRQDLNLRDENEELLIYEILTPPSADPKGVLSLTAIGDASVIIHHAAGGFQTISLDRTYSKVSLIEVFDDDESRSGRGPSPNLFLPEEHLVFCPASRSARTRGSVTAYRIEASANRREQVISSKTLGPSQLTAGKLVGIAQWGGKGISARRVLCMFENGALCVLWNEPKTHHNSNQYPRSLSTFALESMILLKPLSTEEQSITEMCDEDGRLPIDLNASGGLYTRSLAFYARGGYITIRNPNGTSNSSQPEHKILKSALDASTLMYVHTDPSYEPEILVCLSDPRYVVGALRVHFGRGSRSAESIPHMITVNTDRMVKVTQNHFRLQPSSATNASPVVVDICLTETEICDAMTLGTVRLHFGRYGMMKGFGSTNHLTGIAIDAVEVFVIERSKVATLFSVYSDESYSGSEWGIQNEIVEGVGHLLTGALQVFNEKPNANTQISKSLRGIARSMPFMFRRILPLLFRAPHDQARVEDVLDLRNYLPDLAMNYNAGMVSWSVTWIRHLGRASWRSPRATELAFRAQFDSFLDVERLLFGAIEFIEDNLHTIDPRHVVLALVGIARCTICAYEMKDRNSFINKFIGRMFGNAATANWACDALIGSLAIRLDEQSNYGWTRLDLEDAEYFQCDACLELPVRQVRYHCEKCENYDLCERCLYTTFSSPHEHELLNITIDGSTLKECQYCGEASPTKPCCKRCECIGFSLDHGHGEDQTNSAQRKRSKRFGASQMKPAFTLHDIFAICVSQLHNQPSPSLVKFMVCYATLTSKTRLKTSVSDVLHMGEELMEMCKRSIAANRLEDQVLALKFIGFAVTTFARYGNVEPKIFEGLEVMVTDICTKAFRTANFTKSTVPTAVRSRIIPSWFGLDQRTSILRWQENIAWFPLDALQFHKKQNSLVLSSAFIEDIALDRQAALNPMYSLESVVLAAIRVREACALLRPDYQNDLSVLRKLFTSTSAASLSDFVSKALRRLMGTLHAKTGGAEAFEATADFSLCISQLEALYPLEMPEADRKAPEVRNKKAILATMLVNRLYQRVVKSNVSWQEHCINSTSTLPVLINTATLLCSSAQVRLARVCELIRIAVENSPSRTLLVRTLKGESVTQILLWQRSSLPFLRTTSSLLLASLVSELCFSPRAGGESFVKTMVLSIRAVLDSSSGNDPDDVERLLFFTLIERALKISNDNPVLAASSELDLCLNSAVGKLLDRLQKTLDRIQMHELLQDGFYLRWLSGVLADKVTPIAVGSSSGDDATGPRPSTPLSTEQNSNRMVLPLAAIFDNEPCLRCHSGVTRNFSLVSLESLRTKAVYQPSSFIFRLKQLSDIRQIIVEMTPTRKSISPMIDAVNVYISSQYLEPQDTQQSTGPDPILAKWDRVASITSFEPPKGNSSSSGVPVGQHQFSKLVGNQVILADAQAILIKFEFVLAKDRGDADRLVCPRCSKPVVNDHGVCSNCSEMVFQCRQCRNINYEDLRSFLCVQCGFCRHFRFSFRLEMRPSNFYPEIQSEKEFDSALKIMKSLSQQQIVPWSTLESLRDPFWEACAKLDVSKFERALNSINTLKKAYVDAKIAREDTCALRARLVEFRQNKRNVKLFPTRYVREQEFNEQFSACLACDYLTASALLSAITSLMARSQVAAKVASAQSNVSLLLRAADILDTIHEANGQNVLVPPSRKGLLAGTSPFMALIALALNKKAGAFPRILEELRTRIEGAMKEDANEINVLQAIQSLSLLGDIAVHPKANKNIVESALSVASLPLTKAAKQAQVSNPLERLCHASLETIEFIMAPAKAPTSAPVAKTSSSASGKSYETKPARSLKRARSDAVKSDDGPRTKRAAAPGRVQQFFSL